MKKPRGTGPLAGGHRLMGFLLALAALPAAAQIGPLSNQTLFFDQASNAHRGNYLEADTGLIYTDNVTRAQNGSGDTLALLGLVGDASRVGPRLDYRLASDIALVKYLRSNFQTQPFGYLDGSGQLWIVPGFFSWTGRETYTQTVIDPFAPVTADNLESLNYVTTGPRFTLHPTLRTTLTLDGTYSYMNSSSKSPLYVNIDNHRYSGVVTFSHAISNSSSVYITGSHDKVEFTDQADNNNFRQDQALAGFKITGARTVLDLSGGYTKLHEAVLATVQTLRGPRELPQSQVPGGAVWRVDLSRQISPSSRLSLHAVKQVTDSANLLRLNLDQPVATTAAYRLTTGDPFTDSELGATWQFAAARTSFTLGYLDIRERYKIHPTSDRNVKDATALLGRQLSPVLNWDIGAEFERQEFAIGGSSNTVNAITSLGWQVGRQLRLRFLYAHSALTPHGYAENQVGVMASYAFIEGTQGSTQPGAQPAAPPSLTPGMQPGSPPQRPQ
jgi:hypothetical protein